MKESGAFSKPKALPKEESETEKPLIEISSLKSEVLKLTEEKNAFERALKLMMNSSSWKLTAPLRKYGGLKRALWPLWSWKKFPLKLSPGRSLIAHQNAFSIVGPSGVIQVEHSGAIPAGWYNVDATLETEKPHFHLLLYFRAGPSFSDSQRAWISIVDGKSSKIPFQLPQHVEEFRIDLIDNNGKFTIQNFSLQRLGLFQVILAILDRHLISMKNIPAVIYKAKRLITIFREGGIQGLKAKFGPQGIRTDYQDWVRRYDTLDAEDRDRIKQHIAEFPKKPEFSVIMPVYNTPERWLTKAIDSVRKQLYEHWELIIVDDASTAPAVKQICERYKKLDSRIKVIERTENGHIAKATQDGLAAATKEFVALVDHDDEIPEHALYRYAVEIIENPEAQFFYSDEDKITEANVRFNPYFKPNWDPELLRSQNFVCHLSVFKTERMKSVGGYRAGTEGAQDWDMILRYTHGLSRAEIRHIPEVLYHWRVIETSTAHSTNSKPYVLQSQKKVIEDHLAQNGLKGSVQIDTELSHMRVVYDEPNPLPRVSVIIPTKDQALVLKVCIDGLFEKTNYPNLEIIIVDNGSTKEETQIYFQSLTSAHANIKIIRDDRPFNFSRLNNEAVKQASGEIIAFLNNDIEMKEPHWLREMVTLASRKDSGAVGARLLFPFGLIQHAGVILGIGGVGGHDHKGKSKDDVGYFNRTVLRHETSAVTAACLVIRRSVFEEVGGFDEENLSIAFNDVDFCLKIREKGYVNLFTPFAELIHHESISRGLENTPSKFQRFEKEVVYMKERWKDVLADDPYYNPNLTLLTEDYTFAFPSRVKRKWDR